MLSPNRTQSARSIILKSLCSYAAFRDRLASVGGGLLVDAIRRDDVGAARALLQHTAWTPDLESALELQAVLPAGWQIVVRDGGALLTDAAVALGRADGSLERRAELDRLAGEVGNLERQAEDSGPNRAAATARAAAARDGLAAARATEARVGAARRAAEEAERVAARRAERLAREVAWQETAAERAEAELARHRAALGVLEASGGGSDQPSAGPDGVGASPSAQRSSALAAWELRVNDLRTRRDQLAAELAERDRARSEATAVHAREAAGAAMSQDRIERADREMAELGRREVEVTLHRDRLAVDVAAAHSREESLRLVLAEARAADAQDRALLAAAESSVTGARDRLRSVEERLRGAEVAELENRLALDLIRDQVLAELGGLGSVGLRALGLPDVPDVPEGAVRGQDDLMAPVGEDDFEQATRQPVVVGHEDFHTGEGSFPGSVAGTLGRGISFAGQARRTEPGVAGRFVPTGRTVLPRRPGRRAGPGSPVPSPR